MAITPVTDADFESTLAENPKVVAMFWAGWCGSCKLFKPKFRRMSEEFSDTVFVLVDAEENPEARKKVGVSNLPFFAVFENGELKSADFTAKEEGVRKMVESLN